MTAHVLQESRLDGLIRQLVSEWVRPFTPPMMQTPEHRQLLYKCVRDALWKTSAEIMRSSTRSLESGVDKQKTNDGKSDSNWDGSETGNPSRFYTAPPLVSNGTLSTESRPVTGVSSEGSNVMASEPSQEFLWSGYPSLAALRAECERTGWTQTHYMSPNDMRPLFVALDAAERRCAELEEENELLLTVARAAQTFAAGFHGDMTWWPSYVALWAALKACYLGNFLGEALP